MNVQRIVVGGLVAGLLINAGGFILAGVAERADGSAEIASLSGAMPLPVALLRGFLLGMFCVLLYAALRPHLKPGPRTAATAGLLAFIFGVLFPPFGTSLTSTLPATTLLAGTVGQAVILPLATMAGAWLYREEERAPAFRGSAA